MSKRKKKTAAVARPPTLARPPAEPGAFLDHVLALTNQRAEIRALAAAELKKKRPPVPAGQELPPARIKRTAWLGALKSWRDAATARLADLQTMRTGSGPGGRPIPDSSKNTVMDLKR